MSQLKQSVYFPKEMRAELQAEAKRLKKPLSWVAQKAWLLAREAIQTIEAPPDLDEKDEKEERDA